MSLLAAWLTTYAVCVVSALVPVISAEVALIAAVAAAPAGSGLGLALAAALGQITGQGVLYGAGAGALRLPGARFQRARAAAEARLGAWQRGRDAVFFGSAVVGLPPFFLVSIASGVARYPVWRFVGLGLLGRYLRFAGVVLIPTLLLGRG